jgi:flagellar biosynthesis protein FlhA
MNALLQTLQRWFGPSSGYAAVIAVPILVMLVLAMLVLPLPPWLLDLLFTLNIAIALMVMMVAAYMRRAMDFIVFPTVLLLTTLMRLALNVASTRVVLMEGHQGTGAAGNVIESVGGQTAATVVAVRVDGVWHLRDLTEASATGCPERESEE